MRKTKFRRDVFYLHTRKLRKCLAALSINLTRARYHLHELEGMVKS